MLQVLGEWSSQIYTRYLVVSITDRLEVQELIAGSINTTAIHSFLIFTFNPLTRTTATGGNVEI